MFMTCFLSRLNAGSIFLRIPDNTADGRNPSKDNRGARTLSDRPDSGSETLGSRGDLRGTRRTRTSTITRNFARPSSTAKPVRLITTAMHASARLLQKPNTVFRIQAHVEPHLQNSD